MTEKMQFDVFLGGSEELPAEVSIQRMASARANEIAAMTYSIENPHRTKLVFQKLPVHMRRRIMSHNAKRMPRRLREAQLGQMTKAGMPPKSKRPSRKYRRRPQNLLLEYNRRQRDKIWLETHIWHAKRFRMIEKWGYKLPNYSNDRCFRASYRAVAKHCLIQDISYYACVELVGPGDFLAEILRKHCNPNGLSFGAKIYVNGSREGSVLFFKKDGYPRFPIGTVRFVWRSDDSDAKTIWIWAHPSFYSEFLSEIVASFNFELVQSSETNRVIHVPKNKIKYNEENAKKTESTKLALKNVQYFQTPKYHGDNNTRLTLLKDSLNRFRLSGALTLAVLTDALQLPNFKEQPGDERRNSDTDCQEIVETPEIIVESEFIKVDSDSDVEVVGSTEKIKLHDSKERKIGVTKQVEEMEIESMDEPMKLDIDSTENAVSLVSSWHTEYYQNQDKMEHFKIQKELFEVCRNLKSPNQLPPNIVMALTVLDPRFFVPEKRAKSQINMSICETVPMPPTLANLSPLWESRIRDQVVTNLKTTAEVNNLRSKNLVPGISNDENYNEDIISKVPILLIQTPGCSSNQKNLGFSSGIDIVLPAGWAMPFWLAMILRCARSGGLRESKSIVFENLNLNSSDINPPDTLAYAREAVDNKLALLEKYFRYPPNRRVNFVKLGISSPFFCEWRLLMKEWTGVEDFYVLRDRNMLKVLQENTSMQGQLLGKNKNSKRGKITMKSPNTSLNENVFNDQNCLVTVKVSIEKKGCPKDFAIICEPTDEDLLKFEANRNWSGPVEKLKVDPNEVERKSLRTGHLALLKRLRRQRVGQKKKVENSQEMVQNKIDTRINLKEIVKKLRKISPNPNQNVIDIQSQKMKNLYLPTCKQVRYSCDREIMGYVIKGDFSFTEAKGIGLGYVVLNSLFKLIKRKGNIVLIRNTKTRQYRFATIDILIA